jgi:Xaa-Pro aminopeptidase
MPTEVLPDEAPLRLARRARAFAAMEAHNIDVLFLGREGNARYVSGAPRLWTAGSRAFGPGCVVVRSTGAIHLLSTWDEGMPDDIPHENLFGITWNPGNLIAWLKGIDGMAEAKRIGTDSSTPRFARWLPKVFESAEFVDAEPVLDEARAIKTPEEVGAIRASLEITEAALAAAVDALGPGVSERHLAAVFMEAMAARGVTTPATQRVASVQPGGAHAGRASGDPIAADDLVTFDVGVVAGGYVSEVGRTWPASPGGWRAARVAYEQADRLWTRLLESCQPGASCQGFLKAYESEGHDLPVTPVAYGLGLGFDVPVVSAQLPRTAAREHLAPGMVLALVAHVGSGTPHAVVRKDVVLVGADGPEVLSSSPQWTAS